MPTAYYPLETTLPMRGRANQPRTTRFAQWLTDLRVSKGLTMTALAERAGISHARISQIEKGDEPTREMVEKLARAATLDDDPHIAEATLNSGLRAAFIQPDDLILEPILDELSYAASSNELSEEAAADVVEYIKFKREQERKRRGLG